MNLLTSSRQSSNVARRIEQVHLSLPASHQALDNLPIRLIPQRQLPIGNLHNILSGIHILDQIGLLHVSNPVVESPRDQCTVLVVVQLNRVREGIGQCILVLLYNQSVLSHQHGMKTKQKGHTAKSPANNLVAESSDNGFGKGTSEHAGSAHRWPKPMVGLPKPSS